MKIAYETTALELDSGGVARYVRTLGAALARRPGIEVVDLAHPAGRVRAPLLRGLGRELTWFPHGLGRAARAVRADVLHCPGQLGPPLPPGLPLVTTIFDVMSLDHPEWFRRANAAHTRLLWPRILRRSDAVIVAAEFTRERLLERFPWLDERRVHVVALGIDVRFAPRPATPGTVPYVLTVGRLQPRKNLEVALAAFERVAEAHPELRLLVVGARGWHDHELVARLRGSPSAERIELLGYVTDEELVALYQGASCFLFPSLYEGFGFPPLEAMACGTPVVCSDATTLPEVVGEGGLLVDALNAEAVADALERVLADATLADELRRKGIERAARFTWDDCADATARVYAEVL